MTIHPRTGRALVALAAALLASLLLASCAPAARGSSAFRPQPLRPDGTVSVEPGQTVYLARSYAYADFSLAERDFGRRLWVPEGATAESANVADQFALRNLAVPPGWTFEIERLRALRETRRTFGRSSTSRSIEAVFRLEVPGNAPAGFYTIDGTVAALGGSSQDVALRVRVP